MAYVLRIIGRTQLVFLCVFALLVLFGLFLTGTSKKDRRAKIYDPETGITYEEIGNQLYVRDHKGYLYPKGYFDVIPTDKKRPFKNVDLNGRHSDTVLPECDDPSGVDPALTDQNVGWVHPPNYLSNYKNPCWYDEDEEGNSLLRCIPYFYLIGMAKSGSTDLFWRIQQHPDVEPAVIKEHRWFDNKRFENIRKSKFSFYLKQFWMPTGEIEKSSNKSGYHPKVCGDGSPSYSWDNIEWYKLPENQHCLEPRALILSYIHHLTPKAKLILILRNPTDRLYSHYLYHSSRTGALRDPKEFHSWVVATLEQYQECYKNHPFRFCMYSKGIKQSVKITSLTSSIYSRLLLDILKIFPRKQLHILEMKDYSTNAKYRMKEIFEFLELRTLNDEEMTDLAVRKPKNSGKFYNAAGPMLNKTRKILNNFFKPFNEELSQMMKDDRYLWRDT